MNAPSNHRVAVIGGGLSGLATAVHLQRAEPSLEIKLFEANSRLGGVIHTERVDGFLIDHGADMFATNPPAALQLCQQLGLQDRLIEPELAGRGARIVHRGRLVPIPDGFVLMRATKLWPMLTTPLLSPAGKLRFLAERWIRPRRDSADESVADFIRRRMGAEVLDRIVAPLAAGIYTADINKLSMRATMGPIAEMEQKYGSLAKATAMRKRSGEDSVERSSTGARYGQFRAFRGGSIELIESLAACLPPGTVETETPICSLGQRGGQWLVESERGGAGCFDRIVLATPPRHAAKLLRDVSAVAAQELGEIESASTAIVVLGVQRADIRVDIDTFGFVVPLSERRQILAGSFASHKFAGRAAEGQVLIRVFIGGAMQPELLEHSDQELIEIARSELAQLIGLSGTPLVTRVVRWNQAMPQYHVGHRQRVERIERAIDQCSGLLLVNNGLHGVGIAPVIQAAQRTAQKVVQGLQAVQVG